MHCVLHFSYSTYQLTGYFFPSLSLREILLQVRGCDIDIYASFNRRDLCCENRLQEKEGYADELHRWSPLQHHLPAHEAREHLLQPLDEISTSTAPRTLKKFAIMTRLRRSYEHRVAGCCQWRQLRGEDSPGQRNSLMDRLLAIWCRQVANYSQVEHLARRTSVTAMNIDCTVLFVLVEHASETQFCGNGWRRR